MRIVKSKKLPLNCAVIDLLLDWIEEVPISCLFTSNGHDDHYGSFEILLGVGAERILEASVGNAFSQLANFRSELNDWILGSLSYDLKNELEDLDSQNNEELDFPDLCFFQPKKLIRIKGDKIEFLYLPAYTEEVETDFENIFNSSASKEIIKFFEAPKIKMRFSKDRYCEHVSKMLDHIKRGDIYEANFCQEFYAEEKINPISSFKKLNALSEAPFATYLRLNDHYALCSSPERFLAKRGNQIISQPIKGTARRSADSVEDLKLAEQLAKDPKERTENIMITDLVRNDLSKNAKKGSVKVKDLCKVYTYKQVHQMISTITSLVEPESDSIILIKNAYPMGSMTGAPKVSAMQIIEELEVTKRGLYSGSVGYFTPDGDFDFNVVIRSILYNSAKPYVSFSVGSAITAQALPQNEYEECLLKAKAMRETLDN
ncbi:anthranilate synthase component I family protein [Leeuwenhoekiella marinoflava]|uniref:Para-aminobenzoate synthetase component 1 n=2 Tax=Leeuwenhoekiella marinoflava TaxID=988 RepID=A0A4V1KSM4_9FLAO|nr:anthranilate synthase component I family protein [Leeuwenhoekiella marinoflava]RXG32248.1 para-aminobenzoate synthetase component 1 [Leeuwenhoekiella marinoflava]SHE81957.1 para-aminobenzoate synthetase component 1 [Leeuwenhoekiella marinoflava DSM 3653]